MRSPIVYVLVVWACLAPHAAARVVMTYSVQRHGARDLRQLAVNAPGGPTLLPNGRRQAWDAGNKYRQLYLDPDTCGTKCIEGDWSEEVPGADMSTPTANLSSVYVRASSLTAPLLTGMDLLNGMLPPPPLNESDPAFSGQVVPVFPLEQSEDSLLFAANKCPAFDARLEQFYQTELFQNRSQASEAVRESLAPLMPGWDLSMQNLYNTYNYLNFWRINPYLPPADPPVAVDNATFTQIKRLAFELELTRTSNAIAGNLLGGQLLHDLQQQLEAAVAAVNVGSQDYVKVVHLVGTTASQLALLGALNVDVGKLIMQLTIAKGSELSLGPGAMLLTELHASNDSPPRYAVHMVVQDHADDDPDTVELPCMSAEAEQLAGKGSCTLESFMEILKKGGLDSQEWCAACSNNSTTVCGAATAQAQLATCQAGGSGGACEESCDCGSDGGKIALSVILTFLGTLALGALLLWLLRRGERWPFTPAKSEPMSLQLGEANGASQHSHIP